jgi:hypothetical protein
LEIGFRRPEGHGAARTAQRNLREFRLDALAELEPDFAWPADRSADGWRRLLELGMSESLGRDEREGKRCGDS